MRHIPSYLDDASHECFVVLAWFNDSASRTRAMRARHQANTMNLKHHKSVLLGTSALVCLALAAPVMAGGDVADVFVITSSDGSTNGNIGDAVIDGSDTVSLGIDLTTTGTYRGIKTNNNDTEAQSNTVTVTGTGSITTGTGNYAHGIFNDGAYNTTTVSGSIKTTGFGSQSIRNQGSI